MTTPSKSPVKRIDPTGRIDVLCYRLATEYLLPEIERCTGLSGLAAQLAPHAEAIIADMLPPKSILPKPKPRRRLC